MGTHEGHEYESCDRDDPGMEKWRKIAYSVQYNQTAAMAYYIQFSTHNYTALSLPVAN